MLTASESQQDGDSSDDPDDARSTNKLRSTDRRRRRVAIVVDDSEDAQDLLRDWLQMDGFIVHQARDGRQALEMLVDLATPSLIVLDILMPVMGGLELLDIICSYTRLSNVPVLVVTASDAHIELKSPYARCLRKPLDEAALRNAAAELLSAAWNPPR